MRTINKKIICLVIIFLGIFLIPKAFAAPILETSNSIINIKDDNSIEWSTILNYSEQIDKSDYFIFTRIYDVRVYSNNEDVIPFELVQKDVGSLIITKDLAKYNTTLIRYEFKSNNQVTGYDSFRVFRHGLSITDNLEYFSITVKLPVGATLVDKLKLKGTSMAPFEPAYGQEGSDGQRILVSWELKNPRLGEPVNIILLYENIQLGLEISFVISIIFILVIGSVLVTYYFRKMKFDMKSILSVLSDGERKIMEIIIREKKVDQRIIVRETDFSKAKVSRIIQSLTARGLIDTTPKGRTKLIAIKPMKKTLFQIVNRFRKKYKISKLRLSKEQALELTQFLTDIVDSLSKESKEMEMKEHTKTKQIKISGKLQTLYNDIKILYPTLDEKMGSYNKKANDIEEMIQKVKQIINKKHRHQFEQLLHENNLSIDIAKDFPNMIIDNKTKANDDYKDFWELHGKKILKIRESKALTPLIQDIEKNREEMERMIWDLKESLEILREEIRKSYNILVKDFYKE
ncbi:MAG: hypothetical protein V1870_03255 [Candidatus Aenigmatarchaeota archaeon]